MLAFLSKPQMWYNFTLLLCRALEKNVLRGVSHVQHDYFSPFEQSNRVFAALALPQWFLKIFAMDASILLGPSPTTHCLRLGDTAQVHHWEQLNFHGQVSQLCLWVPGKENRCIKHCYPQITSSNYISCRCLTRKIFQTSWPMARSLELLRIFEAFSICCSKLSKLIYTKKRKRLLRVTITSVSNSSRRLSCVYSELRKTCLMQFMKPSSSACSLAGFLFAFL